MPDNKRREATRRQLEHQLQERQEREARRKQVTLISSVVGSVLVVALIVVIVVVVASGGDDDDKKNNAKNQASAPPKPTAASSSAAPQCGSQQFPTKTVHAAKGKAMSFAGVSVKGAKDLTGKPGVTSHSAAKPTALKAKDLVAGTGAPATPTSCVTVQYDGVLLKNGTEFDSSWKRGQLAQFPLTGVVPGFTQGIGGTQSVPPMKVGGRRVMILPAALGYGASPPQGSGIPPNAPLAFVVDLVKVT